ncbi:unnamed protein product [Mytilus coruscus]|uniref:Integrase zinc-binding domain-containing protein n=1 Tax=Mytilus coruscus TaxID=42192 RepID=A0A6J8CI06_MYTCO|nr:unnamed protein product [Mytilus coruscus]
MGNDVATSDDHMTKSIGYGIQGATYGEQVLGSGQFVNNSMSNNNHTDRVHDFNTGVMQNHSQYYENNARISVPNRTCNNMYQNFNSDQGQTDNQRNASHFSQNRMHAPPIAHFKENTSAQSVNRNFTNSQVQGQCSFAHGNNWGTNGGDNTNNQSMRPADNTVKNHRKLKEPDLFDGIRTEWPDYICHFEQVAQWNRWSESETAAQLAMSLRGGLGSAELKRHVQFAHPTTLDRAISLAVEFEAFEGAQIYPRKPKDVEERPVLALTNSKLGEVKLGKRPSRMRLAAITQYCWVAKVFIGNIYVNMLVDTGSAVTLISKNVFEKLGVRKSKLTEVSTILTTEDGEPMKVMGASDLLLQLNNHEFIHSAIVADLGNIARILGFDFLSKNEVTINASKGTWTIPKFTVKLLIDSDVQATCARVQLADTVQIPGRAEMFVRGKIDAGLTVNVDSILETIDGFQGEKHVLIPKSVVQTSDTAVVFSVLNPTPHAVILKRNLTVASLKPIQEIMEDNFHRPTSSTDESVKIPEHLLALTENVSDNLTFSQRSDLGKVISEYADFFVGPDRKLGRTDLIERSILTETDRPVKVPPRRLPISQREVAAAEKDKMLKNDIIEPSHSPYSAPIVLDGTECHATVNAVSRSQEQSISSNAEENVTREIPVEGQLGNYLNTEVTDSNWSVQWGNRELVDAQTKDGAIGCLIRTLEIHSEKTKIKNANQEFNTLLRQWDTLTIRNGILFRQYHNVNNNESIRLQLLTPRVMRHEIMHQLHNARTAGHLGREKTLNRIKFRYYWPGMSDDVARWVQSCISCQNRKPGPGLGKSPMHYCTVYGPMECIAIRQKSLTFREPFLWVQFLKSHKLQSGNLNEPIVHSTPHTVVDNLSNMEHTSCYTNKGDLDHMYGPQTQSKQYKTDITSQDGFKNNPSTREQDTHSYEYYDISDSNVNPHAINHTNKSQNNQQDRYSHNQTINRQANPVFFGTKHHSN